MISVPYMKNDKAMVTLHFIHLPVVMISDKNINPLRKAQCSLCLNYLRGVYTDI